MGESERQAFRGDIRGFPTVLTSFIGRDADLDELSGLIDEYRLVTLIGPGGVGKTRLAVEAARRIAGNFADGARMVELAAVEDPDLVPVSIAAALGARPAPGVSVVDSLVAILAREQILLVLDNCEHVLNAVAQLCSALLPKADDVKLMVTSREPLGLSAEARFRLRPLELPGSDSAGQTVRCAALTLFADRARQFDSRFKLTDQLIPLAARIVTRLDGMPLAIELAAARVEALGLAQLVEKLDDRFKWLTGGERTAALRQQSLAAAIDWSYQLLSPAEQQVFRHLAIFPAPFTLDAAEAVAGPAAAQAVLHLVDCSLLSPPLADPDGRARYTMLESLRVFALDRLALAGEQDEAMASLVGHAVAVAERAAAGMNTRGGELVAARWLDAENAAVHQALDWAIERDAGTALKIAVALVPWWRLRGRLAAGQAMLHRAIQRASRHDELWCTARVRLGLLLAITGDYVAALGHITDGRDGLADGPATEAFIDALVSRSLVLRNLGQLREAADDARHALTLARQVGYATGEATALAHLCLAANYQDDQAAALEWATLAQRVDQAALPDKVVRLCATIYANALLEAHQVEQARQVSSAGLAQAQAAGDVGDQANLLYIIIYNARRSGQIAEAAAHLGESIALAAQSGDRLRQIDNLDECGHVCAATGQWADAVTLWAAYAAHNATIGAPDLPQEARLREEMLQQATQALGASRTRAAFERGTAMPLQTAAELAAMLTSAEKPKPPNAAQLSPRERELVALVGRGHTDAQIADQLIISVRTVRSHLDRIRDKTGSRRRADLTRLALQGGLV